MIKKRIGLMAIIFFALSVSPARADIQDWMPDSVKWMGTEMVRLGDSVITTIKEVVGSTVGGITKIIKDIWGVVQSTFTTFFEWGGRQVGYLIETVGSVWTWVKDAFSGMLNWFWKLFVTFMKYQYEMTGYWLEWGWWAFKQPWLLLWWTLDKVIGWFLWAILTSLKIFRGIDIDNAAFRSGIAKMIEFGMRLNKFVPLSEAFYMYSLYSNLWLLMAVYRLARKCIPFMS